MCRKRAIGEDRHAAEPLAKLVEDVVNAFATMLAHQARANLPLADECRDVVLYVVELGEHRLLGAQQSM